MFNLEPREVELYNVIPQKCSGSPVNDRLYQWSFIAFSKASIVGEFLCQVKDYSLATKKKEPSVNHIANSIDCYKT